MPYSTHRGSPPTHRTEQAPSPLPVWTHRLAKRWHVSPEAPTAVFVHPTDVYWLFSVLELPEQSTMNWVVWNNGNVRFTVLETRSLESRRGQDHAPSKTCKQRSFPCLPLISGGVLAVFSGFGPGYSNLCFLSLCVCLCPNSPP